MALKSTLVVKFSAFHKELNTIAAGQTVARIIDISHLIQGKKGNEKSNSRGGTRKLKQNCELCVKICITFIVKQTSIYS